MGEMGDTGCKMQDARCRMQDARCKMQDAGCRIQEGIREWGIGNRGKGVGNAGYRRWKMEREFGISRTYYFRSTKGVFKAEIMQEIEKRGHEVGYHYEVLDKAKGNYGEAIDFDRVAYFTDTGRMMRIL